VRLCHLKKSACDGKNDIKSVLSRPCPKNDVISFSRKHFCALGLSSGLMLKLAEIRFRSNVHSGKYAGSQIRKPLTHQIPVFLKNAVYGVINMLIAQVYSNYCGIQLPDWLLSTCTLLCKAGSTT